jgi:periplasmic divalent cation tolerance protein
VVSFGISADLDEILVVYVTAPEQEAPRLARAIVERKLAACANIIPHVRSIYTWEGAVQDEPESLMIMKTTRGAFESLRKAVVELHPYQVAEVIGLPVALAHEPYARWVCGSVAREPGA